MLYGTQLQLPGEYFAEVAREDDPQIFLEKLRQRIRKIKPKQTAHHDQR